MANETGGPKGDTGPGVERLINGNGVTSYPSAETLHKLNPSRYPEPPAEPRVAPREFDIIIPPLPPDAQPKGSDA